MNVFLSEFSREIGSSEALVIMDGAGWHKSTKLNIPTNIEIMYLPPYSPELNPVERLCQYIKNALLKNKIYKGLDELEEAVCYFITQLKYDTIQQICSLHYTSI